VVHEITYRGDVREELSGARVCRMRLLQPIESLAGFSDQGQPFEIEVELCGSLESKGSAAMPFPRRFP